MYLASKERSARSSFADRIGNGDVAAHWLIDDDRGGASRGKVGLIEIGAGGSASLGPEASDEEMVFVLDGHGVARVDGRGTDVREGSVIFVPAGQSVQLQARDETVRVLLIYGGRNNVADVHQAPPSQVGAAPTQVTHLEHVDNVAFHKPELGFLHVAARWLVSAGASKSQSLVVGQSTFVPGGAHLLHKHDHGDEFFYVFEGEGAHLIEGGEVAMKPGDVVFAPRGEWHGFRNKGDRPVRAIFGYFGVASLEEAGYEVHEQSKVGRG